MTTKNLMKLLVSKYKGEWVSITRDYKKVVAHSKAVDDLVVKIRKQKVKDGVIMRVPAYIPTSYAG
jgi:hypothetical protein